MNERPRAVVLLSGGLDSAVVLAIALREGFEAHALTFRYGQRHAAEIEAAERVAKNGGAAGHRVVEIDPALLLGSALTGGDAVPKGRSAKEIGVGVPSTFVFGRNLLFLSCAVAGAGVVGARDVLIGVNEVDCSGYPDCRPEFVRAFENAAVLATNDGSEGRPIRIRAPLAGMNKKEIVRLGVSLDVDLSMTLSCYDPSAEGAACGECDACSLRLAGFRAAGISDLARYVRSTR